MSNPLYGLKALFPNADFTRDIILADDGTGEVRIANWNLPNPIPSEAAIAGAAATYVEPAPVLPKDIVDLIVELSPARRAALKAELARP